MRINNGDRIIKDQVDNLQVSFDKEAAWMRLQDRMESKDEKKVYSHVGWAAAAMLIVGSVLWYMLSEPKAAIVHAPSIKKTTPVNNHSITKQDPTNNAPPIAVKQNPTPPVVNKKNKTNIITQQPVVQPAPEPPSPVIVLEEKPVLQEIPKVVVIAPKPKMKRIHINDLEEEDRRKQKIASQREEGHYAISKKNSIIKPSVEREDAEENTYSLWGIKRTEIN